MSLSRVTTWSLGDILTAAALEGEFNNILNNAMALISPATANFDLSEHLIIDAVYKNVPITFTAQDGTPDVSQGTVFKTANASATTISMFDGAVDGQRIWVMVNDANTTFDFTGTNLIGNNGVDWSPALGDSVQATFVNPKWHCRISGSELAGAVSPVFFPATQIDDPDPNALDDYEEGTWTPSVGGSATYSAQNGSYVKIGKYVIANFQLFIDVIGTGSNVTISGLPFAPPSNAYGGRVHNCSGLAVSVVFIALTVAGTTIGVVSLTGAGTSLGSNLVMTSGTQISGSVEFFVS